MAFRVILRKTLVDLTGFKGNLALLIIGVGISVLLLLAFRQGTEISAEMQMIDWMGAFLFSTFMWSAGFFLAITVSVKAAGLIADESSESTLTLLVSRPIGRWQILAGKFAALVIYGILLDLIVLLLAASILALIKPVTGDTLIVMLSAIFRLIPYILLVTVIFGSISIALSTITSRRIAITAIMCAIVAGIFYFGPMIVMIAFRASNGTNDYAFLNLGGHLGNIFITVVQSIDGGHYIEGLEDIWTSFIVGSGPQPELLPITGHSDLALEYAQYPFEYVLSFSPIASLGIWLCVSALCLFGAFRIIERKQVT